MTLTSSPTGQSLLLNLPPELRCQIYEYIIGSRVVYVRMNWTGIFSPTGFFYNCFDDLQPLLECSTRDLLSKAVSFGTAITALSSVCRQMRQETCLIPFKLWIWAFEDAFTLDQFVTARGLGRIHVQHKHAIRRLAVAPPGHHRSHEKVLQNLQEVLLINPTLSYQGVEPTGAASSKPRRSIVHLRRDTLTDTWKRSD